MRKMIGVVLTIVLAAGASNAGMCPEGADFYLECLEGQHVEAEGCMSASHCFECLGTTFPFYRRWGIAAEREHLFELKSRPYRDRLIEAARAHLDDPQARYMVLRVLAFQGISHVGDVDVFAALTKEYAGYEFRDWYCLAALQDPRTPEFAEEQYLDITKTDFPLNSRLRKVAMDIVDCLYHLRTKQSRAVLKHLADQEEDQQRRQYIRATTGI